jgi:hypothetical protein
MEVRMTPAPSEQNRFAAAKAEFFRMVAWIAAAGVVMVVAALFYLSRHGPLEPAVIGATIGGVFLSITIGCGLFAAAFFSDKSGHDEAVAAARDKHDPDA